MLDHLFRKLTHFVELNAEDRKRIQVLAWRVDRVEAGTELVHEGDHPHFVNMTLDGWAYRYKQLKDGRRQIIALLLPGDICDPCVFLLRTMSHALATLTPCTIVRVPERDMLALMETRPALMKAFWLDMMISAEVQREWTVCLGQRNAIERMAHLFCELMVRLCSAGLADANECDIPLTQSDLGAVLGLSSVHVNRTLQELRMLGLIQLRSRRLTVFREDALQALCQFNPTYLHLQRHPPPGTSDDTARH